MIMPVKLPAREDIKFMKLALAEAAKGVGRTHPNPAVGALVVKNGRVLSRGWHRKAGSPHAEIEALNQLASSRLARGATLYVTLEPCSTEGRTPPCTEAILATGIARVVYGATDPNPLHAGRAEGILRRGGVRVTRGVLAEECALLNEAWNKWIVTGLPWVVAKVGMSLDGRITSHPEERWITSAAARQDAMRLRAACGAILVGGETIREDDPRLTIRGVAGVKQPWRAVWTRKGSLPRGSRIFTDRWRERTLVYRGKELVEVLKDLGRRGVERVLIEGGGRTLGEAFDRRLVDSLVFYVAPVLLGGGVPAVGGIGVGSNDEAIVLAGARYEKVGGDLKLTGRVVRTSPA